MGSYIGYTHYWKRIGTLPVEKFTAAVNDCKKITNSLKRSKIGSGDGTGNPIFHKDIIEFNGVGDDFYETFCVERIVPEPMKNGEFLDPMVFCFCKTAQRPYDICVQCSLIVLKHHLGEDIDVSSDGDMGEWNSAMKKCNEVLGYGLDFKLSK